jgi:hypothetical protein
MVFATVTLAAGVVVTFLPLAVPGSSRQVAAVALLAQAGLTPVARWAAGRYGDRHDSSRLLVPAVAAAALGTAGLVWADSPLVVIAGMSLFGAGFGAAQNVTLAVMFERVPRSEFGRVSALWEPRLRRRDGHRRRRLRPARRLGRLSSRVRPDRGHPGRRPHPRQPRPCGEASMNDTARRRRSPGKRWRGETT